MGQGKDWKSWRVAESFPGPINGNTKFTVRRALQWTMILQPNPRSFQGENVEPNINKYKQDYFTHLAILHFIS